MQRNRGKGLWTREQGKEKSVVNYVMINTIFKGALSGLRQFLVTECPLKIIKNTFYITLKALFILKIFAFLS